MIPPPLSPGLYLSDYVIIEENTRKVSLIGCFIRLTFDEFPVIADPFSVFSILTNGLGNSHIRLVIGQAEKEEIVYEREIAVHFPDKLAQVYLQFRISDCEFPEPGLYEFTLLVDNEWVADRPLRILRGGTP
jgi:hypothetical protein